MNFVKNAVMKMFVFAICLLTVGGALSLKNAHANITNGWAGSVAGGIPAITKESFDQSPFWCNQSLLLAKTCKVVAISASQRVALVNLPRPDANCPNGVWGLVDRESGQSVSIYPGKVPFKEYCRGNYKVAFVKSTERGSLAKVVMYFNNKPIDSMDYIEE